MRTGLLLFLVILVTNSHPNFRKLGTVNREDCEKDGKVYKETVPSKCVIDGKNYYGASKEDCDIGEGDFTPAFAQCVDKTSNNNKVISKYGSDQYTLFNSFISYKFGLVFITYLLF